MQGIRPSRIAVVAIILIAATLVACASTPAPTAEPTPAPPGFTVTEAIALRDAGELWFGPFCALNGYWSNHIIRHTCGVGSPNMGELELGCYDHEYKSQSGTNPSPTGSSSASWSLTEGPRLVPWMQDAIANQLFGLPKIGDAFFPPVPIVVRAHFNDPRAADCRAEARQACRDRLIIDALLVFDPSSVPPPTPTPPPTRFQSPPQPPSSQQIVAWGTLATPSSAGRPPAS